MGGFGFQRVERADLPRLAGWLATPAVEQWWPDPDRQIGAITQYLDDPAIRQMLVCHDDVPVAYLQFYPVHRWQAPQYAGLPSSAIALDVFSGPGGMGHGAAWLRAIGDSLLTHAPVLAVDPSPDNARAIRACLKAGFTGDTLHLDDQGQTVRVMTRRR